MLYWSHAIVYAGNRAECLKGPVTDYGSSMVQWMRHRQPRYKGGVRMEMERPSPSYIVDVCRPAALYGSYRWFNLIHGPRCYRRQPRFNGLSMQYLRGICILLRISSNIQLTLLNGLQKADVCLQGRAAESSLYGMAWASILRLSCR